MVRKTEVNSSLSREDWLRVALDVLNERGVDSVKVLPLSKALGVTRGSFYWHFKNREDLLQQMLEYWEWELTDTVIEHARMLDASAEDKLRDVVTNVLFQSMDRYDTAVRAWSLFDGSALKTMKRVERKRLRLLAELLNQIGLDQDAAQLRAQFLYGYLMSGIAVAGRPTQAEKAGAVDQCMEFILN
ncbi:MAG: TetR/AcrR family transcriptional regulator [Gammaproteobacteria bacterium]|nr:TetR/AcrR family transcriptional regulator [Gammaproteobacteria bacterium]